MLRALLLSRQCQFTAQALFGVLAAAVFTVARPLHFPHACLAPVFVVIIIASLAQDQHVGSRIQVTALLLGPAWLAVLLAASLMSLAKLAAVPGDPWAPGYVTAATLLALLGLAVLVLVRVSSPPGPGRLMGVLAAVLYGIMVLLSVAYTSLQAFLVSAIGYVVVAMVLASAISLVAGLLVAPSLASDEVARLTAKALQGAGAVLSYHTSALMADQQTSNSAREPAVGPAAAPAEAVAAASGTGIHMTAHATPAAVKVHGTGSVDDDDAVAAAAAAGHIAAAREHEHATLDWVDELQQQQGVPIEPRSTAMSGRSARSSGAIGGNTSSQSGLSVSSLDDLADSEELERRSQTIEHDAAAAAAAAAEVVAPMRPEQHAWLDEQMLLAASVSAPAHESEGRGNYTAAWVAAAAVVKAESRQASLLSESSDGAHGPFANVQMATAESLERGHARKSLEHAASLEFMPEADDQAFLQAMRTLSKSRPYGSTASLPNLLQQLQQQQQVSKQQDSFPKPATSVASTTGSVVGAGQPQPMLTGSSAAAEGPASPGATIKQPLPHTVGSSELHQPGVDHVTWAGLDSQPAVDGGVQQLNGSQALAGGDGPSHHPKTPFLQKLLGVISIATAPSRMQQQHRQQQEQHHHHQQKQQHQLPARRPLSSRALTNSVSWADLEALPADTPYAGCAATAADSGTKEAPLPLSTADSSLEMRQSQITIGVLSSATDSLVQPARQQTKGGSRAGVPPQPQAAAAASWCQEAPTTAAQLGLLIGRAKVALAAARLEPQWLRPKGVVDFDADAWATLLEDAELLLVRVSTLEALSDERRLQGLCLHNLQAYRNIADAMAMTLAQLAAFLAHVSRALEQQQASRHVSQRVARLLGWGPPRHGLKRTQQQQQQWSGQQHRAAVGQPPAGDCQQQRAMHPEEPGQVATPFAAAAAAKPAPAGPDDASASQDVSWSAVLSGLERQGSGVSSYLWEKKAGWETGRQLLQREMEAAVGGYWWSVRRASRKAPVKVPRSREVMTLTFIWPITNGLLDALERVEASAQRVLSGTRARQQQTPGSRNVAQATAAAAAAGGTPATKPMSWLGSFVHRQQQQGDAQPQQQQQQQQGRRAAPGSRLASWFGQLQPQMPWVQPLLKLLLLQPGLQAVQRAIAVDLPKAVSSKQGFADLLRSRTFQAGLKLYLATGSTLLLTMLLMVYVPAVRNLAPIFGFTSACLSMQERVEATTDKVAGRTLGTIVGGCLGLAIIHIPDIFSQPVLLLACIGAASAPLSIVARAQARVAVALALITLLAVTLCTYEVSCCSPGAHLNPNEVFLARLGSVVGTCIYVGLLNRLVLPWYTSDYALEQMADALEQAAALFGRIYLSQHARMKTAAVIAGAVVEDNNSSTTCSLATAAAPADAHAGRVVAAKQGHQLSSDCTGLGAGGTSSNNGLQGVCTSAEECSQDSAAQQPVLSSSEAAAAELAELEAAEAGLHLALRQEVLSRLIDVQLSLAKDSVSWKRGVLATPQVVLDVLGAMIELVEALACQRLALAPFTRSGARAAGAGGVTTVSGGGGGAGLSGGLLRVSGHCYSVWAKPLHPVWLEVLTAVQDLAAATAQQLRTTPAALAASTARGRRELLLTKLSRLESARLDLRRGWLAIRTDLHKHVRAGSVPPTAAAADCLQPLLRLPAGARFWPIDSIHFFTFTYGASRVLNKMAGVAQALLAASP